MTDDRSERLRKRRKRSIQRQQSEVEETATEKSKPDKLSKLDETDERDEKQTNGNTGSVKEHQTGTYMYLPERQVKELSRVYNVLKAEYEYEHDESFEKNRHFYPLVVQYGLDRLEGMDATEIRARVNDLQ